MRYAATIGAAAITLAGMACSSSTKTVSTWKDPNIPPPHFQHIMVLFVSSDPLIRRTAEDRMASQIAHSVQSYKVVPDSEVRDPSKVRERVKAAGFDGAVVMRLVSVNQTVTAYAPGNAWYTGPYDFWGYWGTSWGYAYDPGYYQVNQVYSVETAVYSVTSDKLIFAARTETVDPYSLKKLVNSVVDKSIKTLHKENVI